MKKQLQAMLDKLEKLKEQADDLSSSDNETTADKYSDVYGSLDSAYAEIEAAIERMEETD